MQQIALGELARRANSSAVRSGHADFHLVDGVNRCSVSGHQVGNCGIHHSLLSDAILPYEGSCGYLDFEVSGSPGIDDDFRTRNRCLDRFPQDLLGLLARGAQDLQGHRETPVSVIRICFDWFIETRSNNTFVASVS